MTIAVDHMSLAAIEEGLGTCWIGAFTEDQVKGF
ncbi:MULTISPECIES: nitroreductase family protein [Methanothrix]|nr:MULTISPECIES: nitroreductase family protein [Methanothrix]MBP7068901.1 nitroreductase family protein [Methanothrix sp.]